MGALESPGPGKSEAIPVEDTVNREPGDATPEIVRVGTAASIPALYASRLLRQGLASLGQARLLCRDGTISRIS